MDQEGESKDASIEDVSTAGGKGRKELDLSYGSLPQETRLFLKHKREYITNLFSEVGKGIWEIDVLNAFDIQSQDKIRINSMLIKLLFDSCFMLTCDGDNKDFLNEIGFTDNFYLLYKLILVLPTFTTYILKDDGNNIADWNLNNMMVGQNERLAPETVPSGTSLIRKRRLSANGSGSKGAQQDYISNIVAGKSLNVRYVNAKIPNPATAGGADNKKTIFDEFRSLSDKMEGYLNQRLKTIEFDKLCTEYAHICQAIYNIAPEEIDLSTSTEDTTFAPIFDKLYITPVMKLVNLTLSKEKEFVASRVNLKPAPDHFTNTFKPDDVEEAHGISDITIFHKDTKSVTLTAEIRKPSIFKTDFKMNNHRNKSNTELLRYDRMESIFLQSIKHNFLCNRDFGLISGLEGTFLYQLKSIETQSDDSAESTGKHDLVVEYIVVKNILAGNMVEHENMQGDKDLACKYWEDLLGNEKVLTTRLLISVILVCKISSVNSGNANDYNLSNESDQIGKLQNIFQSFVGPRIMMLKERIERNSRERWLDSEVEGPLLKMHRSSQVSQRPSSNTCEHKSPSAEDDNIAASKNSKVEESDDEEFFEVVKRGIINYKFPLLNVQIENAICENQRFSLILRMNIANFMKKFGNGLKSIETHLLDGLRTSLGNNVSDSEKHLILKVYDENNIKAVFYQLMLDYRNAFQPFNFVDSRVINMYNGSPNAYYRYVLDTEFLAEKKAYIQIVKNNLSCLRRAEDGGDAALKEIIKIPRIITVIEEDEFPYFLYEEIEIHGPCIVMEEVSEDKPQTEDELKEVYEEVEKLHRLGICHMDLSLRNLSYSKDQGLKIFDFGYAQFQDLTEEDWDALCKYDFECLDKIKSKLGETD